MGKGEGKGGRERGKGRGKGGVSHWRWICAIFRFSTELKSMVTFLLMWVCNRGGFSSETLNTVAEHIQHATHQ